MTASPDLVISNVRLAHGESVDLAITHGLISAISPAGESNASAGSARLDGDGGMVSVPFVDGHMHLDKTFLGHAHVPHRPGEAVRERIRLEKELRQELAIPVATRGEAFLRRVVRNGTLAVRSHVDIDPEVGLSSLEALLTLRERWAAFVPIQIVAFPQQGVVTAPGTAELLGEAMTMGADLVGGLDPHGFDGDVDGQLDIVFGVAEKAGKGLDIHLHDGGPAGLAQMRQIADRTMAAGLQGQVAISHAFALGEDHEIGPTVEALAHAGVAIMTHGPGPVPMPPVAHLRASCVTVFAGSDNVRDAWSPFGNGDMLERAMIIGYRQGANTDEDLAMLYDLPTGAARRALGLPEARIAVGEPADLIVLAEPSIPEALAEHYPRKLVMKAGKVLAQNGTLTNALPGGGSS